MGQRQIHALPAHSAHKKGAIQGCMGLNEGGGEEGLG